MEDYLEKDTDLAADALADDGESTELYEHFRITADKGQTQLRIDKFLVDRLQSTARNRIQNAARAGNILVNGTAVKPNYKVKPGDVISIVLPHPPHEFELQPENIPVDIVYEDDDVLVVNKAPGMVVHPGFGNFTGTLVQALMYHVQGKVYLVHRIDKDTSGLLLVAKNEMAQTFLAKQFFDHSVERKYYALVWGDFKEDDGTVEGAIGRSVRDRRVMTVYPDGEAGKEAVTHYHVEERFGYVTRVSCVLETGRTHQIRCHMRYIKHPLFN
ncbi:MAG: RluA family pseudouridine synthase, partial [Bacteroidales bacterium]|nr:RluA family pseudouridine synthase [Bacteroidales bacterium]